MISSEDADLLEDYHWSTSASSKNGYYFIRSGGRYVNISLHKTIAQREYPYNDVNQFIVDFINGNTLDLRRNNLRLTDRREDALNRRLQSNKTSKYCGVYQIPFKQVTWVAANSQPWIQIGKFETEIEAAIAWGLYNGYDGPKIRERYK
jgi:hypothetical protein